MIPDADNLTKVEQVYQDLKIDQIAFVTYLICMILFHVVYFIYYFYDEMNDAMGKGHLNGLNKV